MTILTGELFCLAVKQRGNGEQTTFISLFDGTYTEKLSRVTIFH